MGHGVRPLTKEEQAVLDRLKRLTAKLPDVTIERDGFGHSVMKVGKRSFVILGLSHDGDGRPSVAVKTDPATQDLLVHQGRFERTPYIGQHGWVSATGTVRELPWPALEGLLEDAWRAVAPKRVLKRFDGG